MDQKSKSNIYLWLVGVLVLTGFWFRLSYMLGQVYHVDEFISMLAATMVAQKGLPFLPSGLFYDHGLLFSEISGLFVALLGFSEEVSRWPSIFVSVLTIAAYYAAARRLFNSRLAGVVAAALAAFDQLSIVWGARARMYSLAHFCVLLSLVFLLEGTFKRPSLHGRYLFLLFLSLALLSHTISFLLLIPLAVLVLAFSLFYRRSWLQQPGLWLQVAVAVAVIGAILAVVAVGQLQSTVSLQDPNALAPAPLGLDFLRGFLAPAIVADRFDDLFSYFEDPAFGWLLPLVAIWWLVSLSRLARRRGRFSDVAFLFFGLLVILVVLEQGTLFTNNWVKARYLFILAQPTFFLLAAQSVAQTLSFVAAQLSRLLPVPRRGGFVARLLPLVGVLLVTLFWGQSAWHTARAQNTGNYNTAFEYVKEHLQPGDKIITIHPAAAYLYAGQVDYYANQVSAKVLEDEEETNSVVDRYAGRPLIDSADDLNQVLAQGDRVWFVVDDARLYRRFTPYFVQQIFAQMDLERKSGQVYIFKSRPFPLPVPAEPADSLDGNFNDQIFLQGYTLGPARVSPDGTASLALFWRPAADVSDIAQPPKVFVQLRNNQGQIIAQADHFFYEGLLTLAEWDTLRKSGEWLRDTADLQIPLPLAADGAPYRLFVGLYNPLNFERIPIVGDASGENAVIIDLNLP